MNSVNCPACVSTSILPPCCFTMMSWLIERPSPVPSCEKWVEYLFLHFRRDASTVVADADLYVVTAILGRGTEGRLEIGVPILGLTLAGGIESVRDQIEKGAGNFLREQFDLTGTGIKVALQRDIEPWLLCSGSVIGEIKALVQKRIDIYRPLQQRN